MSTGTRPHFYEGKLWRLVLGPVDRLLRILFLLLVQLYQFTLSFLLGGQCRFYPTCSDYAADALTTKPIWRSLPLIIWRVVRCNPFCNGGHEEIPEENTDQWTRFNWPKRKRRFNL